MYNRITHLIFFSLQRVNTVSANDATMRSQFHTLLAFAALIFAQLEPNFTSNAGVDIYNPSSFFNTTGPWSLMSQAGDTLYIAGTPQPH